MTRVTVTRDGRVYRISDGASRLTGSVWKLGRYWRARFPSDSVHPSLFQTRAGAIQALEARQDLQDALDAHDQRLGIGSGS